MKKTFINDFNSMTNPAEAFLSKGNQTPSGEVRTGGEQAVSLNETAGHTLNKEPPKFIHRGILSKRLNLLTTHDLYRDLEDLSYFDKTSVNNLVNYILDNYVKQRLADVQKFRSLK